MVDADLTLPGDPRIFVLSDTARVDIDGKPVPGLAPRPSSRATMPQP